MDSKINAILEDYCGNEMKKLKAICYPMLIKIGGISQMDYDDFYDIAMGVLQDSISKYEETRNCQFKTFLTRNIDRKFKTEIRDRNRKKRIPAKKIESLSVSVGEDGLELIEKIPSNFDVHEEAFGNDFKGTRVEKYLKQLSSNQRKIVLFLYKEYKPTEIKKALHMSDKEYQSNLTTIQAYENVRVLMRED